jgi:hypothetical protein
MEKPDEDETSSFKEGLADTYEDGILRGEREGPLSDAVDARNVPPPGLSAEGLRRFRQLVGEERRISAQRRRLHDRIDFVKGLGDAGDEETASRLAYLLEKEREVSRQRKELHRLIDRFK